MRLLAARGLVKYKATMIRAFRDAYRHMHTDAEFEREFKASLYEAVHVGEWGTDHHLFALSLLLDRPIFHFNTDTICAMHFLGVTNPQQFAHSFLSYDSETRYHSVYCTSAHTVLLASGNVHSLPNLPICLFNKHNFHWIALLPRSQSVMQHIPIPQSRILAD